MPAAGTARGAVVWPGAMSPVSNDPSFDLIRCTWLSVLRQDAIPPGAEPGLGVKDRLPLSPTIVIAVLGGGVGGPDGVVGVDGELPPPHAASPASDARAPIHANLEGRMPTSL
jgi:hypothetical protein